VYHDLVHELSEYRLKGLQLLALYLLVLDLFHALKKCFPESNLSTGLNVGYLHQLQKDRRNRESQVIYDLFSMVSPELDKDVHELLSKLLVVLSHCLVHLAYQVLHFGYHSLLYRREVCLFPGDRNEFDDAVGCIFEVLILVGLEFSKD